MHTATQVFHQAVVLSHFRLCWQLGVFTGGCQLKWEIYQLDEKSAFLNGFLEEEIYIEQPQGFIIEGKEDKVLILKKALYGLKQA